MSPITSDAALARDSSRPAERVAVAPAPAPAMPGSRPIDRVGVVVLACAAGYMLIWWNRYLSPTVGFELMFADEFARGHLPYRDYYFPVQPGWVLASIAGVKLFGARLIGFWALGAAARLVSVGLTYRLLTRICPPAWAGGATVVAFVASCGDVADFPAWYNYLTAAFATYAAFAAVRCVEADDGPGRWTWAVLTGLALALEFLTKQTAGILVGLTATSALFLALCWRHGPRRAVVDLLAVVATAAVPCLLVAGWLVVNDAWPAYVDQVYVRGPSSKGGLVGSLRRIAILAVTTPDLRAAFLLAGWIAAATAWLRRGAHAPLPIAVLIGVLALSTYRDARVLQLAASALGLAGSLAIALVALGGALRGRRDPVTLMLGIVGGIAFASTVALALSWPLFEPMIWPGLALSCAALWRATPAPSPRRRRETLAVALGVLLIGTSAWRKHREPASWGGWVEPPVSTATTAPALPRLAGFRLSPATARFYEQVTALIKQHARPGEPILVFPHMPLLYGLAERPLATFSYMHYPDVCPDYVAEADAERLRRRPPTVIVSCDFPEADWTRIEQAFRKDGSSGQKTLRAVMRELVARDYAQVGEFPVGAATDPEGNSRLVLRIWARR